MRRDRVLLNSGGMDSFLLAYWLDRLPGPKPLHVFVDVGQTYVRKESRSARRIAAVFLHDIEFITGAKIARFEVGATGIIPFRNAELILCAAQYGDGVYLGVIGNEVNSDKSPEFLRAMKTVLDISHREQYWTDGRKFELRTPLRSKTKTQLVGEYLRDGGNEEDLLKTVSCYDAIDNHCGKCPSCFKRWVALENNGLQQRWEVPPWEHVDFVELAAKMEGWHELRQTEVRLAFARVGINL